MLCPSLEPSRWDVFNEGRDSKSNKPGVASQKSYVANHKSQVKKLPSKGFHKIAPKSSILKAYVVFLVRTVLLRRS